MLVLSRGVGEEIVIGGGIVVTVVQIRKDSVRLGIDAPKETPVHRREVWDTIETQVRPLDDASLGKRFLEERKEDEPPKKDCYGT